MNWDSISFDWNQVRAFLATAEQGSFSAAARALKTTQPTINRQISGLEQALDVVLFERTRRGLTPTTAGQQMLAHVREMGTAASRISMVATTQSETLEGEVSVTAVDVMCHHFVVPTIAKLQEEAPGLSVRIRASNQIENISAREADIAVRHVRPSQPDLFAKLSATFTASLYASKAFLDKVGRPASLEELVNYPVVGVSDYQGFTTMLGTKGTSLLASQFRHPSNTALLESQMVKAGLGMGLLSDQVFGNDPLLEKVLPGMHPVEFPVWLTTHKELHTSRKIRVLFDALDREIKLGLRGDQ